MKEIDAKKLRCCGPCPENTGRPCFVNKEMGRIEDLVVEVKELDKSDIIYLCSGSECMAWMEESIADYITCATSSYGGRCGLLR